ncbi:hypothetical protein pb186bvf_002017, partial [Paramecium bursaria]
MKFASVCLIVCNFICTITTIVGYIEIYKLDVDQITMNRTILQIYLCIGILSFLKFIMNVLLFREIKRIIFVKIEAIPIVPIFGTIETEQMKTKFDDQKDDDQKQRNQLFYVINSKQQVNQIELIDGIPVGIPLKFNNFKTSRICFYIKQKDIQQILLQIKLQIVIFEQYKFPLKCKRNMIIILCYFLLVTQKQKRVQFIRDLLKKKFFQLGVDFKFKTINFKDKMSNYYFIVRFGTLLGKRDIEQQLIPITEAQTL